MSEQPTPPAAEHIDISPARPEDAGGYLQLVDALAHFEKLTPPDAAAKTRLIDHLFGDRPYYKLLVARDTSSNTVIGYSAYFLAYSTFLARPTFYLEDLFVLPEYRHLGVGHRLMVYCAKQAVAEGCERMDFLVLDWNKTALDFYARHAIPCQKEWLLHRLNEQQLLEIADMP